MFGSKLYTIGKAINASAVRGEPGTGFEKASKLGEFECENCKFYGENAKKKYPHACYQKDMMKKSKQPRNPDRSVKVEDEDCCEYVWRIGRKDKDKE